MAHISRNPWPAGRYEALAETAESLVESAEGVSRLLFRRGASTVLSDSWYEPAPNPVAELVRYALALDRSPFARDVDEGGDSSRERRAERA